MRKTMSTVLGSICVLGSIMLVSGCGANRLSLAREGAVTLEAHASGKVYVAWSDAYESEEGFVVTGVVRRDDTVGSPIKVSVHVTIISPDGQTLDEGQSGEISVPRRMATKVQGFERFNVRFPSKPPEGSTVQIVARST